MSKVGFGEGIADEQDPQGRVGRGPTARRVAEPGDHAADRGLETKGAVACVEPFPWQGRQFAWEIEHHEPGALRAGEGNADPGERRTKNSTEPARIGDAGRAGRGEFGPWEGAKRGHPAPFGRNELSLEIEAGGLEPGRVQQCVSWAEGKGEGGRFGGARWREGEVARPGRGGGLGGAGDGLEESRDFLVAALRVGEHLDVGGSAEDLGFGATDALHHGVARR